MASSKYLSNSGLVMPLQFRRGAGLTLSYTLGSDYGYALIENCTFRHNHADVNESNDDDIRQRPSLYVPRGHGGALLVSFQNTSQYIVQIVNCTFINNSAHFTGGAISIHFFRGTNASELQSSSTNNTVTINDTVFQENMCSGVGGAVSINTFEAANSNQVTITRSRFERNSAELEGGAYSFIIEVSSTSTGLDIMHSNSFHL